MSRLEVITKTKAQSVVDDLYKDLERRIVAAPPGLCPVDMTASFLKLFHTQTCGKCVPCRIGLGRLEAMLERILDGECEETILDELSEAEALLHTDHFAWKMPGEEELNN